MLASLGASISHISSSGHIVLGSPIGSQEYASTFAEHKIDEARRVLKLITDLLLDRAQGFLWRLQYRCILAR